MLILTGVLRNSIFSMKRHFTVVVLAIAIGLSGHAEAKLKLYKSNTNLPFVEMMLNMMVVMGILDKIPPELLSRGGYPGSPWNYHNPAYRGLGNQNLSRQDLMNQYLASRTMGRTIPGQSPFAYQRYRNSYQAGPSGWLPLRPSTCVGGSCLSQRHNSLNGLWIGEAGEMLGIRDDQFLWTDGRDRHMSGLMNISEDHVVANVDGSNRQISYDYKVQGNELLTKDSSGVIRHFRRYPSGPVLY